MIYVMSDIHGRQDRFEKMLKLINFSDDDHLYILGDVVDRNPDGIKILRKIMKMPNVSMLIGNHEDMMLNALYRPLKSTNPYKAERERDHNFRLWYNNGGLDTHHSLKHQRIAVRKEIFEYLESLPINIDITVNGKNYLLVHGAPYESYPFKSMDYGDPVENAIWGRVQRYDTMPPNKKVIFGHTPTLRYQDDQDLKIWTEEDDKIGIDCGCGWPAGRLGCLRLDDMEEFYVD